MCGPSLEHTWIPFKQGRFVSSLVEISQTASERKSIMWKINNDTNADNRIFFNQITKAFG